MAKLVITPFIDQVFKSNKPRVLIFFEKHGVRYFDASNGEKIAKSVISILRERLHQGCWYSAKQPEMPEMLKPTPISEAEQAQKILDNNDKTLKGKQAFAFLYARRYNEYEQMEIVDLEIPD